MRSEEGAVTEHERGGGVKNDSKFASLLSSLFRD